MRRRRKSLSDAARRVLDIVTFVYMYIRLVLLCYPQVSPPPIVYSAEMPRRGGFIQGWTQASSRQNQFALLETINEVVIECKHVSKQDGDAVSRNDSGRTTTTPDNREETGSTLDHEAGGRREQPQKAGAEEQPAVAQTTALGEKDGTDTTLIAPESNEFNPLLENWRDHFKSTRGSVGKKDTSPSLSSCNYKHARDSRRYSGSPQLGWSGSSEAGWKTPNGVPFAHQIPGRIVYHKCRHDFPRGGAPRDQGEVIQNADGSETLVKNRYHLIIEADEGKEEVTELEIFTYGDNGLAFRSASSRSQYLSIKPFGVDAAEFINQSPDNPILEIDWMREPRSLRNTMVARYTKPETRKMRIELHVTGSISLPAVEVVRKLINNLH